MVIPMLSNQKKYSVIYDGDCGFCQSTVNIIRKLDWLKRFEFIPFQNEIVFKKYNYLSKEMCEKEMYLVKNDSIGGNFYGGYDAFKIMSVHLPLTFLVSWFFFLPGVVQVGRIVYKTIAKNRHKIKIRDVSCKTDL